MRKRNPYPPLATALAAVVVRRSSREVALFDAKLPAGEEEFAAEVRRLAPRAVAIIEANFDFLTKVCAERDGDGLLPDFLDR